VPSTKKTILNRHGKVAVALTKSHRHWRFRIHRQREWLMTTRDGKYLRDLKRKVHLDLRVRLGRFDFALSMEKKPFH
jgi:formylmethanofuran dehydrogenase subunit E